MSLQLRDLERRELDWMADAERELFGPAAWSPALIQHDFDYGSSRYRGAELDGELVGYAVYGWEADSLHLMNIAVLPSHRRRGIGRAFMDDILQQAEQMRAPEVWLEVAVNNDAALKLYRSYGFEQVRIRKRYYQPEGVDAIVMRKSLRPFRPEVEGAPTAP